MAYLEIFKRTVPTGKTPFTNDESFFEDLNTRKANGDIIGSISHTQIEAGYTVVYNVRLWKNQDAYNRWTSSFNPEVVTERVTYNNVNGITYEGSFHRDI